MKRESGSETLRPNAHMHTDKRLRPIVASRMKTSLTQIHGLLSYFDRGVHVLWFKSLPYL